MNARNTKKVIGEVSAYLLTKRLAKSRYAGYGQHLAGVIRFAAGDYISRRYVVSLGGECTELHEDEGMAPIERDDLARASALVKHMVDAGFPWTTVNAAVALALPHCVTDAEEAALLIESYE